MDSSVALIASLSFLSVYSYFVYPLVLLAARKSPLAARAGRKGRTPSASGAYEPGISMIITAHNEQDRIRPKLDNSLGIAYDPGRLEIIVASDASTDGTDSIVASFPGVKLVRVAERKGKEHAQRHGIMHSTGEILVFTDVATLLDRDALSLLVRNFRDPAVGALSSTDRMIDDQGSPS